MPALAAQLLISGDRLEDALAVVEVASKRFRHSVRLRQLRGLALRRMGRTSEAVEELEKLRADGHNDPETLGILGAAWTALWRASGNVDELERARDLYAFALQLTPTDTYTGINAASKSALMGDDERARELASKVREVLQASTKMRGGQPSPDYWDRVTEPEALLLLGDYENAPKLYHSARIAHQTEVGSIKSTAAQLVMLMARPHVPDSWRAAFRKEFSAYWPAS